MLNKILDTAMDHPIISFSAVAAVMLGTVTTLAVIDENQWQAFSAQHQCKLIAHADGYSTYGYYNGKYQSYYVPGRNTYHCNDGVDYTR